MIRPNSSPEVRQLAHTLGIESHDPAVGIVVHCRQLVDRWVQEAGGVGPQGIANVSELETLITRHLSMVVETIHTDADFDRLTQHYARGLGEFVFAGLRARFDDLEYPAFGVLIQRRLASPDASDRFVAVVDCRKEHTEEKFARRYFTKWHEIAHRMTTHRYPAELAFRCEDDPIETLVDAVASELAFYEPFLTPAMEAAMGNENWLTFDMIESIIEREFPEASFQSCLFACMRLTPTPMVYMELPEDSLVIQKLLPNAAAYAHWQHASDPCDRPVEFDSGTIRILCGEQVPTASVFHRVAARELLYDEIEQHLCDFVAPDRSEFIGRFPSDVSTSAERYANSQQHHGVLAHIQARRVPGKIIALIQY